MKVTSKINPFHVAAMQKVFQRAQIKAVDSIKTDVQSSQTMPKGDTGNLQENSMFVDDSRVSAGIVVLVHSGLPYPRRLYFHPEYNFRKDKNPYAGGMWFEPYINGSKKQMPQILFVGFVKKEMENVINRY